MTHTRIQTHRRTHNTWHTHPQPHIHTHTTHTHTRLAGAVPHAREGGAQRRRGAHAQGAVRGGAAGPGGGGRGALREPVGPRLQVPLLQGWQWECVNVCARVQGCVRLHCMGGHKAGRCSGGCGQGGCMSLWGQGVRHCRWPVSKRCSYSGSCGPKRWPMP